MTEKLEKTDARVRLGMLEEAKRELQTKIQKHENDLKILIAQIKTMQRLIEEAQDDMEHESMQHVEEIQEEINNQAQVLEEMLDKTENAKKDAREIFGEEINTHYKSQSTYKINEDILTTAASGISENRLRELQYKSNWTDKDAADFFAIRDSVTATGNYELNSFLKENVDRTYDALRDVMIQQKSQIKENYQTDFSKQMQSEQFFKPQETNNMEYKPMNSSYQLINSQNTGKTSSQKSTGLEKQLEK